MPGEALRLRATVGDREEFAFRTLDGVASPEAFRPAELRLLDALAEAPPERLLVPEANYGVVGVVMGAFCESVRMTERSARAARLCRHNAARNRVADRVSVALTADLRALPGRFDAAAFAPRGYVPTEVVSQRLADATAVLGSDGAIYLAAAPETGLARYRDTLEEVCADVAVLDDRDDHTVLRATDPADDPPRYATPRTIQPTIDGVTLTLVTYPGLFAAGALDDGTRALAEGVAIDDGDRVLDLACGYGPLGLYAALTGAAHVTLTDDDCVATACARASARRTGVTDVTVRTADGTRGLGGERFDRVLCNPPTHAGAGVLAELMRGAAGVLAADGRLELVHHRGVDFDRYLDPFGAVDATTAGEYRLVTARR